jgi:hypothetical protein
MQEPHSHATLPDDTKHVPLHEDIAQCAREIWVQYGKPADRDLEIWLEAEHQLFSATETKRGKSSGPASIPQRVKTKSSHH